MVKHGGCVPLTIANRLWQGSVWRLSYLVSQAYSLGVLYVLDVYSMDGTHKSKFKFRILLPTKKSFTFPTNNNERKMQTN